MDSGISISNKSPADTVAASVGTTLCNGIRLRDLVGLNICLLLQFCDPDH